MCQDINEAIDCTYLFLFSRNWGMKRGRRLRRGTIVVLTHSSHQRRHSMAKGMTQKKTTKKKPATTVKEKRAAKIAKKKK